MRPRELATSAIGAVLAHQTPALAQADGKPSLVGFLGLASTDADRASVAALRRGVAELGYVEGRTITLDARSADGSAERFSTMLADVVESKGHNACLCASLRSPIEARAMCNRFDPCARVNDGPRNSDGTDWRPLDELKREL